MTANAGCVNSIDLTLTTMNGWTIIEQTRNSVTLQNAGDLMLSLSFSFPGESISQWSNDEQAQLLADLQAAYCGSSTASCALESDFSYENIEGGMTITVILGPFLNSAEVSAAESIAVDGGISFSWGEGVEVTSGGQGFDIDGCLEPVCDSGYDADGYCVDRFGFETGYDCACSRGFEDYNNVCTPTCGDGIRVGPESCDDGNNNNNDGCVESCFCKLLSSIGFCRCWSWSMFLCLHCKWICF